MIKNTARIDTIYPHLTLQNKQSESSLSFTLANLQFACQLTYLPGRFQGVPSASRAFCADSVKISITLSIAYARESSIT